MPEQLCGRMSTNNERVISIDELTLIADETPVKPKAGAYNNYSNGVTIYMDTKAEAYNNLGQMILYQAAEDYTLILAGLLHENSQHNKKECEIFFNGPLFPMLCDMEPKDFMKFCQKQADRLVMTHTISKSFDKHWYVCEVGRENIPISKFYSKKSDAIAEAAKKNGLSTWAWTMLYRSNVGRSVYVGA